MAGLPDAEPLPPGTQGLDLPETSGNRSVPQDNELDPILNTVQGLFRTDDSKAWGADIVQAIQQHVNMVRVADANRDAAAQFANNIDATKHNLLGMVRDDPTSIDLAHTLAPMFLNGLIHNTGVENPDAVHAELSGHFVSEISQTAIQRMAELDFNGASQMLDKYGRELPQDTQDSLQTYIAENQRARVADHLAQLKQMQNGRDWHSGNLAVEYAAKLLDLGTENVTFPNDYMQNLVKNAAIQPDDRLPLERAFGQLQRFGDAQVSDPYVVNNMVNQIAHPQQENPSLHDIMDHVGSRLKYADATMLAGMTRMQTPEGENVTRGLSDVLNRARSIIAPGDDAAGAVAYSRFVNWLMPAVRSTGPGGLNPGAANYLFKDMDLSAFRPNHEDAVPDGPRTPLGEIFSRGR